MTLSEIIKQKCDDLYEVYEGLNKKISEDSHTTLQNEINSITQLIERLKQDTKNLKDIQYDEISRYISISKSDFEKIRLVLKAKYEAKLTIDLIPTQLEIIKDIIKKLMKKRDLMIGSIKEKENLIKTNKGKVSSLEEIILKLEYLGEQVNDPNDYSLLNLEDFETLSIIFEDEQISSKIRLDLLTNMIEYNENIKNQKRKLLPITDIEEVKTLFKEFGFKDTMLSLIDKNKEEISKNINLNNAREILEYLQDDENKPNLLGNFSNTSILTIVLYSDKNTVSNRYNDLKERKALCSALFEIPSVWTKTSYKKTLFHKKSNQQINDDNKKDRLRTYANKISYDEMIANESYLQSLGFNVSLSDKTNIATLETSQERIIENINAYKTYGFFKESNETFPASCLSFSKVADRCDNLIEIGILHNSNSNYALNYPSIVSRMKQISFALLYKLKRELKEDEYYNSIFNYSKNGIVTLNNCLISKFSNKFGYKFHSDEEIKAFIEKTFIDQMSEEYIKGAPEYEEVITKTSPVTYSNSIFLDENISFLEKNHRVENNPYQYKIGTEIISRLKVLRCYNTLKEHGITGDEAFLYSVTRKMYIDEKTFNSIKELTLGRGEYNNGSTNRI